MMTSKVLCLVLVVSLSVVNGAPVEKEKSSVDCNPGQYLDSSTNQCQPCPRGSYQDQSSQTNCKQCRVDYTTDELGARSEYYCYSTNQCETGENYCSWHARCIDLPDENDIHKYECKCKPGFIGNGTHCQDSCIDYCLNDGLCMKNKVGDAECECKGHFTGERCEIRFQLKTQKSAYIAGGIGGIVAILKQVTNTQQNSCIDYCLNDGLCKKNPVGYVKCECNEQFTGKRCENND